MGVALVSNQKSPDLKKKKNRIDLVTKAILGRGCVTYVTIVLRQYFQCSRANIPMIRKLDKIVQFTEARASDFS